jgi:hypothetical protein
MYFIGIKKSLFCTTISEIVRQRLPIVLAKKQRTLAENCLLIFEAVVQRVRVNQWLYFPLSATDFLFLPPQCYISVLPAGAEGAESRRKAESPLTLAKSRAVGLS